MKIKTKVHIMDCKLTLVVPQTIASTVYASLMKNQNQNRNWRNWRVMSAISNVFKQFCEFQMLLSNQGLENRNHIASIYNQGEDSSHGEMF